ncbi:hypothetical protein PT85_12915 [Pseudomonas flexibilis]|uniref:Uncharacterized protein n=1 Tax=Pseudomonas flexibilis TaxID=706570 RepID=A0A0B3BU29_9PSED|nr:hypothetical protein PT85_12915 [Pseudomonas flexibilis]
MCFFPGGTGRQLLEGPFVAIILIAQVLNFLLQGFDFGLGGGNCQRCGQRTQCGDSKQMRTKRTKHADIPV